MSPNEHLRLLQRFTRGRDVPCPVCRYNLREQVSATCPECGHALSLHVGTPAPRFGPLLTTMMPMIAHGGFVSLLLTAFVIVGLVTRGGWGGVPPIACLALGVGIADILGVFMLYAHRAGFLALPAAGQVSLAAACWALHALLLTLVIASAL